LIRQAARLLARSPGFTFVAVLTIALGVGANTAIFTMVDAVLLKPLPYREPDRLALIEETTKDGRRISVSWLDFLDYQSQSRSFESMAARRSQNVVLTGSGEASRHRSLAVSASFFPILGIQPVLGRLFTPQEDRPGAEPVILLSHALWQSRFSGDRQVLGKSITVNGQSFAVVGVIPPDSQLLRDAELFSSIGQQASNRIFQLRGDHPGISVLARLKPGHGFDQAAAELAGIARRLEIQYPASNTGIGIAMAPLQKRITGEAGSTLWLLMAAAALVWLIGCVNVSNLLLARGTARDGEIAVRRALGASRGRLIRLLLMESLLLASAGGLLGLMFALWGVDLLRVSFPMDFPRLAGVQIDLRVLVFALAASMVSAVLFGLVPALRNSGVNLRATLQPAARSVSVPHGRLRALLLAGEVALSVLLLAGAGLMLRTLWKLHSVDLSFQPDQVLTLQVNIPPSRIGVQRAIWLDQALQRISSLPGVASAGAALCVPFDGGDWQSIFLLDDRPVPERAQLPDAEINLVTPLLFDALGIPLRAGRLFTPADHDKAPFVAIINETFARRLFPNDNPIGKRVKQGWPEEGNPWREIVGVVADTTQYGFGQPVRPELYFPHAQTPASGMTLAVRARGPIASILPSVRETMRRHDPDAALFNIRHMREYVDNSLAPRRLTMQLLALFAALALTLAAIGAYGVTSYWLGRRRAEIGIRMTLGARPLHILGWVLNMGARTIIAGVAIGLVAAAFLSRAVASLLYGVDARDPLTFAAAAMTLLLAGLGACYLPARRAMRLNPVEALRQTRT
jgi:putative ABC transport system permease protein